MADFVSGVSLALAALVIVEHEVHVHYLEKELRGLRTQTNTADDDTEESLYDVA